MTAVTTESASTLPNWLKGYTGWEEAPVWCGGQPSLNLRDPGDYAGTADDSRVLLLPDGRVEDRDYYAMLSAAKKLSPPRLWDELVIELTEEENERAIQEFDAEWSAHSLRASYDSLTAYFGYLLSNDDQFDLEIASEIALVLAEVQKDITRAKDPTWAYFNPKDDQEGERRRQNALSVVSEAMARALNDE